jgi:hypothetical protein
MALPDETALRLLAKRKIENGALPTAAPESAFAGKGSGLPCSLCEQPITPNEYELEYADGGRDVPRFHLRCQEVWRLALAEWQTRIISSADRPQRDGRIADQD